MCILISVSDLQWILFQLYTPDFSHALINVFGMDQFLRKLLRFFVESMAGSKDVGSDSEHVDAVDDICHDLMIATSPRETCENMDNESIELSATVESVASPGTEAYCTARLSNKRYMLNFSFALKMLILVNNH